VLEFGIGCPGRTSFHDLCPASSDQVSAMRGKEFMKHRIDSR
jgi:hypothetical protein